MFILAKNTREGIEKPTGKKDSAVMKTMRN